MEAVISCLTQGHDQQLLIASGLICLIGVYASFALAGHAGRSEGTVRRNWALLAIVAAGCTAWATHMVALLAYRPGIPAAFDIPLTALSLLAVIVGIGLSMSRMIGSRDRRRRFSTGVCLGLSVAVLHYVGQYSYRVVGTISWDLPLVAGSITMGLLMSGAAMVVSVERSRSLRRLGPVLLFGAIAVVHIGGMTAMTLSYDPRVELPVLSVAPRVIALPVAGICIGLIVLATLGLRFTLQARAQFRRDRARLNELSNLALEGLAVCDGDVVSIANDSLARLAGVPVDDIVGQRIDDLLAGPLPADMIEREEYDAALIQRTGAPIPVRMLRSTVTVGRKKQIVFAFRDQRERLTIEEAAKAREAELARAKDAAERGTRAKSLFLATVSHELRTPLHGIMGTIDLLRETGLDDVRRGYVDVLSESGDGLLVLVNMLLDLTQLEEGKVLLETQAFDPARIVQSVADLLRPLALAKEIGLTIEVDASLPAEVTGDSGRFRQVLTNIVGNAVKFTEAGSVSIHLSWENDRIQVAVTDTGIGISGDRLACIFDPFTQEDDEITRRFGGTGLGLSISRMLARRMGGDIDVRSTRGVGSTFTVHLPVARPRETVAPVSELKLETLPDLSGRTLLVVDDNRTNRFLVERFLRSARARILQADDGLEAVSAFEEHRPDAILMDISMPRMNGLDATREIRAREAGDERCAIIGLSANAFEEDRSRCLEAGMDGFLAKPAGRPVLIAALQSAISAKSAIAADTTALAKAVVS